MKWYHTYLLHPGLDRTKAMIFQHLYCPGIREAVQKEVTGCDTCQRTKRSTTKYSKLPAKLSEETPWNKLCVDLIGPYRILGKGERHILLKAVKMVYPVTGWFEVTQYTNKKVMTITKLVETMWLVWCT